MAERLRKGDIVRLDNQNLAVGFHYKASEQNGHDYTIEMLAFLLNENGVCTSNRDLVSFNNPISNGVERLEQMFIGPVDTDDETFYFALSEIPERIRRISIAVFIRNAEKYGHSFQHVKNAGIHVYDRESRDDILIYELGTDFSDKTVGILAEFMRDEDGWKFHAAGQGLNEGLRTLCASYGLSLET